MNPKKDFPFINHNILNHIVYSAHRNQLICIGTIKFDRYTYQTQKHLVLDSLARDPTAMKVIGNLNKLINKQRAQYYSYFNRTLTRNEIRELEREKTKIQEYARERFNTARS